MRLRDIPLDNPTTDMHMPTVLRTAACSTHDAPHGIPCFHVPKISGNGYHAGICNTRAWKAGMTGRINPSSLDRSIGRSRG